VFLQNFFPFWFRAVEVRFAVPSATLLVFQKTGIEAPLLLVRSVAAAEFDFFPATARQRMPLSLSIPLTELVPYYESFLFLCTSPFFLTPCPLFSFLHRQEVELGL